MTGAQPNYFRLWWKWIVLFAFLGFGFGIGMTALGWHDASGQKIVSPLTSLIVAFVVAAFFSLSAALTAGAVNATLAFAYRGRLRPENILTALPLSPRVLSLMTACGLVFGFVMWFMAVRR